LRRCLLLSLLRLCRGSLLCCLFGGGLLSRLFCGGGLLSGFRVQLLLYGSRYGGLFGGCAGRCVFVIVPT
jgi:hypothetical protein